MTHHKLFRICSDFEELRNGIHEALVVEVAHLLDLAVMVAYPGIQLLHETLVGIRLVIVNRSEKKTKDTNKKKTLLP